LLVMLQWGVSFWTKRRGVRIFPLDREVRVPLAERTVTPAESKEGKSREGRMRAG
jgi:hypothetical protein